MVNIHALDTEAFQFKSEVKTFPEDTKDLAKELFLNSATSQRAKGGYHEIKGNFEKAFLSQMALECNGLHSSGGGPAHLCHPGDPPPHVVE